jgi:hypothetical protein
MTKGNCSVCALSAVHLAAVENELANGKKFRDVAQACGISKSALHRHWVGCRARRRLAELKQRKMGVEGKCVVLWPEGYGEIACSVATPRGGGCVAFDVSTLAENDVVIRVTFADAIAAREYGEPEEDAAPVEVESDADAEPDLSRVDNVNPAKEKKESPAPEPTPLECATHNMVRVSGDIQRCVNCGHQTQPAVIVGVSRDYVQRKRGASFADKKLFGRFG